MRAFSANRSTNQLTKTKRSEAPLDCQLEESAPASMALKLSVPERLASTNRPKKSTGSARQARVTSRAAPMPSKAEPVSKAAHAGKNLPKPSNHAQSIKSPAKEHEATAAEA